MSLGLPSQKLIHRAWNGGRAAVQDMGAYPGGAYILVAEGFLDGEDAEPIS